MPRPPANELTEFVVPQEPELPLRQLRLRHQLPVAQNNCSQFKFFMARNALYHAVRLLDIQPGRTILVPAYICESAVQPFTAAGATVLFYNVDRRCQVDLSDLRDRIDVRTAAVLTVHYFGYQSAINEIRSVCDEYGIALIEDCAHVFPGSTKDEQISALGDVAVFSWRKFLPVFDGATLILRNRNDIPGPTLKRLPFNVTLRSTYHALSCIPIVAAAKKRVKGVTRGGTECTVSPDHTIDKRSADFETHTDAFNIHNADCAMSRPSTFVLAHTNVEKVCKLRKANFESLYERLSAISGVKPLHNTPPPGGAAWVFPLMFKRVYDAHKIIRRLGVPAAAWDGVRPAILGSDFADAEFLYHHLIFLPVHQGLTPDHIDRIEQAVQTVSNKAASSPD